MTIREYIRNNPVATDAEIVAMRAAEPPVAKTSSIDSTYVTYISIGKLLAGSVEAANNVSAAMSDALEAWFALPDLSQLNPAFPTPSALRRIHSRLDGYPGLDMSDPDAPGMLALFSSTQLGRDPILPSADTARAILSAGYTFPTPITEAEVAAERAILNKESMRDLLSRAVKQFDDEQLAGPDGGSLTFADFKTFIANL